jgi:ATP-binding cassette subfamily B protein
MTKLLRRLSVSEWALILISFVFIAAQVWLDLELPGYMSEITRLVQTPGSAMADVWRAGGYMLLCALGSLASAILVGYLAARVASAYSMRLRGDLFDKVLSFSQEEMNKFSTASLITRSTNDVTQVRMFIAMGLQVVVKAPMLAAWAIMKIAGKSWQWTAATAVTVALLLAVAAAILTVALPRFKRIQILTDNLNRVTRENLTGLRVVRAYNADSYAEKKFHGANTELTDNNLFVSRIMAVINPAMTLMMGGLTLSIYWLGASLINAAGMMDRLTLFSDMVVFSAYAMQVVMAFMMMTMMFIMLPRATVSARRIGEVLDEVPAVVDGTVTESPHGVRGEVEFRGVSFKYPGADEYVLKDISLKVNPGETVAFIGSTGSGKSTLVNLIARFHDATEGDVLVDGVNVKDYTLRALRDKLGYVSQRAVLFSGTVASNVAFGYRGGEQPAEADVKRAVEIARAAEFVEKMDDGYGAAIAQGGANVSGGQKQRLAIARAILRKPEIYVFDDSFSALDYKTDRQLRTALKREAGRATNLIVAQRIGTIREADKIVVLDQGRVVGMGTHEVLLESCGVYQQIAYSQLSREELAHG